MLREKRRGLPLPRTSSASILIQTYAGVNQVVESTPEIKAKPKAGRVKTGINVFRSFVALGVLTLPYAFSLVGV